MDLLVVNSNSSTSITELVRIGAENAAGPDTKITALTARDGPPAIETAADAAIAAEATSREILQHAATVDAAIVACFSDPGLMEIRKRAPFPVIGIAEAALYTAAMRGIRFSIVTVAPTSVPGIERLVADYGLAHRLGGVHALDRGVIASHLDPQGTAHALAELANSAVRTDAADVIILGGAIAAGGMADIVAPLVSVPVIEGVSCAVRKAELICR
ncbi:aspartate/glutamate racemase family protein [Oricola sp.]|uniref:aspartate/glutamate racemase family protein n=1 Tax=Oricola sp. TaxID=1979950 RepID=UPI0025F977F6|nr:aspartate/glutamate racemase family protein [Oricola sp.]MCI5074069.1 aspartate/glutamate racemase family protein [Oricola sp.]